MTLHKAIDQCDGSDVIECPYCGKEHSNELLKSADGIFHNGASVFVACECGNLFHSTVEIYCGCLGFINCKTELMEG